MDIRLTYTPGKNLSLGAIDVRLDGASIETGKELETSVLISLFTDRRARKDDPLPTSSDELRGWWADTFPVKEGDQIGSLLWLLSREKQTAQTKVRAKEYCDNALAWLLEDGIAEKIQVDVDYPSIGVMAIGIKLYRPFLVTPENYTYQLKWDDLSPLSTETLYIEPEPVFYLLTESGERLIQQNGLPFKV